MLAGRLSRLTEEVGILINGSRWSCLQSGQESESILHFCGRVLPVKKQRLIPTAHSTEESLRPFRLALPKLKCLGSLLALDSLALPMDNTGWETLDMPEQACSIRVLTIFYGSGDIRLDQFQ